jgi:hypothetical protein
VRLRKLAGKNAVKPKSVQSGLAKSSPAPSLLPEQSNPKQRRRQNMATESTDKCEREPARCAGSESGGATGSAADKKRRAENERDWQVLHDGVIGLIPQEYRQNSYGAVDCVRRLVRAYDKLAQENHEWRHGFRTRRSDASQPNKKLSDL